MHSITQYQVRALSSRPVTIMVVSRIQRDSLEKLRRLHRLSIVGTSSQSNRNRKDLTSWVVGTKNEFSRPETTAVNYPQMSSGLHGNFDASVLSPSAISQQWSGDSFQYGQYFQQPNSATKTTLIESHHPPGPSSANPGSPACLPKPLAASDCYFPKSTLQSPSQAQERASKRFPNAFLASSTNQSTYDQLEERRSTASTKQFGSKAPHDRFEAILEAVKSAGFNSFDEMATEYYITHLQKDSRSKSLQEHSRHRYLRSFLQTLNAGARHRSSHELCPHRERILPRSGQSMFPSETSETTKGKYPSSSRRSMRQTSPLSPMGMEAAEEPDHHPSPDIAGKFRQLLHDLELAATALKQEEEEESEQRRCTLNPAEYTSPPMLIHLAPPQTVA